MCGGEGGGGKSRGRVHQLNIWEYGDITPDDAREFGVGRRPGAAPSTAAGAAAAGPAAKK